MRALIAKSVRCDVNTGVKRTCHRLILSIMYISSVPRVKTPLGENKKTEILEFCVRPTSLAVGHTFNTLLNPIH